MIEPSSTVLPRKSSVIFGNRVVSLYNKQNNTWLLVIMEFLFSSEIPSCIKYQVEQEKSNSISTYTHELSSIWSYTLVIVWLYIHRIWADHFVWANQRYPLVRLRVFLIHFVWLSLLQRKYYSDGRNEVSHILDEVIRWLCKPKPLCKTSRRMQRHIRDLDCAAGGKFESWLAKRAHNNREIDEKMPRRACVFQVSVQTIQHLLLLAYGF